MKYADNLKKQAEKVETKDEEKIRIKNEDMELSDEEMDQVPGGPRVFNDIIKPGSWQ
ncbi:MAG: hypothetical protein K6G43_08420 [Lachnospiraceae bacterium]|nr:hypothetical protein [Lachnospiraceae bacterium]